MLALQAWEAPRLMIKSQEPSVSRTPLTEQVYLELKRRILDGIIPAGTRLTEKECATDFGVSPTPVREAFNKLRVDGLVRYGPWQGTVVTKLTDQDLHHLFSVRQALECLAVREAGPLLEHEDLLWLESNLEQFRRDIAQTPRETKASHEANEAFHDFFWEKCGNPWLSGVLRELRDLLVLARASLTAHSDGKASYVEHKRIVDRLRAQDWSGASDEMGSHIRRVRLAALQDAAPTMADRVAASERSFLPEGDSNA